MMIIKSRKRPVFTSVTIVAIVVTVVGAAVWGFNIGSMVYSKSQARSYMNQHCELLTNSLNTNDRWWECEE